MKRSLCLAVTLMLSLTIPVSAQSVRDEATRDVIRQAEATPVIVALQATSETMGEITWAHESQDIAYYIVRMSTPAHPAYTFVSGTRAGTGTRHTLPVMLSPAASYRVYAEKTDGTIIISKAFSLPAPLVVHPNPATQTLSFILPAPDADQVVIYDLNGRVHLRLRLQPEHAPFADVSALPAGMYRVCLSSPSQSWETTFVRP
ncbi:MAG: T9SS type A sorting domain-containing protein [Bacteroidia bacterium]|nr:T9SS type A sorting domain-containing protein [Bacteroidia bacterium]